jgi:hypothetical protein
MAHEKLQKQYDKDVEQYGRDAYKKWEYRYLSDKWRTCAIYGPEWCVGVEYRRKEPPFTPEYFTGLNWRDALPLVGKVVEYSGTGDCWELGTLCKIDMEENKRYRYSLNNGYIWAVYIRTCHETHAHPTITIGGVELPRPEVEALGDGKRYWLWMPQSITTDIWNGCDTDYRWLGAGLIHLTEPRAKAWADWWQNTVMAAVRGKD